MTRGARQWSALGLLLAPWLWPAAASAQTCTAALEPVILDVMTAGGPVAVATLARASADCRGGRPGQSLRICLVPRPVTLDGGAMLAASPSAGDVVLDASGAARSSLVTRLAVTGSLAVTSAPRTLQAAETMAMTVQPGGSPCPTLPNPGSGISGTVTLSARAQCSVGTEGGMDFGTLVPNMRQARAQARLWAQCPRGIGYQIFLHSENHPDGPTRRHMSNGASSLLYGLYKDPACTLPWGWTRDVDTVAATGSGERQPFTVHGCLSTGPTLQRGTYRDTITVTLAY